MLQINFFEFDFYQDVSRDKQILLVRVIMPRFKYP